MPKSEESGVLALGKIGCEVTLTASLKGDALARAIDRTACDVAKRAAAFDMELV